MVYLIIRENEQHWEVLIVNNKSRREINEPQDSRELRFILIMLKHQIVELVLFVITNVFLSE